MKLKTLLYPVPLDNRASAAMLALRFVAGLAFVLHSQSKIKDPFGWMGADSSMPGILQALAALAEFGGGIAWMLGALMPLASFGLLCTMIVAVHKHAFIRGDAFVGKSPTYELALLYLVIALVFLFVGPGRYSVDAKLKSRL
jgi:putative oxidoreductase